jgi:hypothetical protein
MKAIKKNIESNKELSKKIASISYYTVENFISDVKAYISAIKERRMLCVIESVAPSGMSRVLKYNSCGGNKKTGFNYRQYSCLFESLGYSRAKNSDGFRVNGCGMDMNFNTNYNNIHDFYSLGFITKEECAKLAQATPVVL